MGIIIVGIEVFNVLGFGCIVVIIIGMFFMNIGEVVGSNIGNILCLFV